MSKKEKTQNNSRKAKVVEGDSSAT